MTIETHAIILNSGEDALDELYRNWKDGNLLSKLDEESFRRIHIEDFKYIRIADPSETDHHNNKSIWVEITIKF